MSSSNRPVSLTSRLDRFKQLYKQHPNAICAALMGIGLFPYAINPYFFFGLGRLLQLLGFGVMLFAAISRYLINSDKTQQQKRNFLIIAILISLFDPGKFIAPFILLLFLFKPGSRVIRGQAIVDAGELRALLNKRQAQLQEQGLPQLEIGGVPLPNDLETLGFFFIGSIRGWLQRSAIRLKPLPGNDFGIVLWNYFF